MDSQGIIQLVLVCLLMIFFLSELLVGDNEMTKTELDFGSHIICGKKIPTCSRLLLDTAKNRFELAEKYKKLKRRLVNLSKKVTPLYRDAVKKRFFPLKRQIPKLRQLFLKKEVNLSLKMGEYDVQRMARILIKTFLHENGNKFKQIQKKVATKFATFVDKMRQQAIIV